MKQLHFRLLLALAILVVLGQGCIKDRCRSTYSYTYYTPVYKTADEVRANIRSNAARAVERPGKIYVRGGYIFLNEIDRGIHIIDNRNPSAPVNKAFIDIPGNMDLAVKGNVLYADLYTDLVAIDIADPLQVKVTRIVDGVFPQRKWAMSGVDRQRIIAEWTRRDTVVTEDCDTRGRWPSGRENVFMSYSQGGDAGKSASVAPYGMGGSMARFALAKERLYTVDQSDLKVFNVSNAEAPVFRNTATVGWGIETIYPFKNNLFIGSTTGMFVYNIDNPDAPSKTGQFAHVLSCDPVIADDHHAYVTLRGGTACRGFVNQLDVLNLGTMPTPTLVKTYPLTNPHGLAKDGNLLFICDGKDGLKIYDATNPAGLQLRSTVTGIDTYDVIAFNGVALVVAKDGLYQYSYGQPGGLTLLSKITVKN